MGNTPDKIAEILVLLGSLDIEETEKEIAMAKEEIEILPEGFLKQALRTSFDISTLVANCAKDCKIRVLTDLSIQSQSSLESYTKELEKIGGALG